MMKSVKQSVERIAWEPEILGENPPRFHFVHHKEHMT
jgi:hypothetical protein